MNHSWLRNIAAILKKLNPDKTGTFEPLVKIDMYGKLCSEDNIFVDSMKVFHTTQLKVTGSSQYVLGGKMKKPVVNEGKKDCF